jgi:hypothetical protein
VLPADLDGLVGEHRRLEHDIGDRVLLQRPREGAARGVGEALISVVHRVLEQPRQDGVEGQGREQVASPEELLGELDELGAELPRDDRYRLSHDETEGRIILPAERAGARGEEPGKDPVVVRPPRRELDAPRLAHVAQVHSHEVEGERRAIGDVHPRRRFGHLAAAELRPQEERGIRFVITTGSA